jgi:hypothetical protein
MNAEKSYCDLANIEWQCTDMTLFMTLLTVALSAKARSLLLQL